MGLVFGPPALVLLVAVAVIGVPGSAVELIGYAIAATIAWTIAFGRFPS
jgi:hypothetical protein